MDKILLSPKVAFCRLDRRVAQEHLDLFKLSATRPTQLRARAAHIMGCDAGDAGSFCVRLDELPDNFL